MESINKQNQANGKKKITIAVIAVALAAVIAGVVIFSVVKKNKKPEIISDQGEIVNYFTIPKPNYANPTPELMQEWEAENVETINRLTSPLVPTKKDFYALFPKQNVKIIKIVGDFWWIPMNYEEKPSFANLPDTFVTTIFTENFTITKNEEMRREVEITPSSCYWLKEVMTPEDPLHFFCSEKYGIMVQIKNLQIHFTLA